jgi:lysophospholipase L1-like esterase
MKKIREFILILLLLAVCTSIFPQDHKISIGTIGNSITHGVVLDDPATQSYPAQLAVMLEEIYGDTVVLKNFGLTTTTMLKNGNVSYWDCTHFEEYLEFAPDICVIVLGTNDTKPVNWEPYGNEFQTDYLAMIDTIKKVNPSTRFILGYPPPVIEDRWGIRDSIVVNGVIPAIDSVLTKVDAELVDFYHPLLQSGDLFPDKIHPDIEGSKEMAKILLKRIIDTDIVHKAMKD